MGLFDEESGIFRPIYRNRSRVVYSRTVGRVRTGLFFRVFFFYVIPQGFPVRQYLITMRAVFFS